jgi:hypothetical protein
VINDLFAEGVMPAAGSGRALRLDPAALTVGDADRPRWLTAPSRDPVRFDDICNVLAVYAMSGFHETFEFSRGANSLGLLPHPASHTSSEEYRTWSGLFSKHHFMAGKGLLLHPRPFSFEIQRSCFVNRVK